MSLFLRKIKKGIKRIPVPFSKNHRYNLETGKIIKSVCNEYSNCIDAGSHEGDILDCFVKQSPKGNHFGFEPLPDYYALLTKKYSNLKNVKIYDIALSNSEGITEFNHVISNPAYSGIKKRVYDRKYEQDLAIKVKKGILDNIIPKDVPVSFIKIDVEGGEKDVLEGATGIISKYSPTIVFEFGIGGSDVYGANPQDMFTFFSDFGYGISLLSDFIQKKKPLNTDEFCVQYFKKLNYYFIAFKT